ncbi:MAG: GNAT family N-acetyltransferase [Anaerolineae bacterium]
MEDYLVRVARPEDADAIEALWAEVQGLHVEAAPDVFRAPEGPLHPPEFVGQVLADPDATLLVAEGGGRRVLGFAQVVLRHAPDVSLFMPRTWAELETLSVTASARGSGVGRSLMAAAETWAAERGAMRVQLGVWEFNQDALGFYERMGYETAMRRMWKPLAGQGS